MKNKEKGIDLIQFLHMREKMHQKTVCGDELEICGAFLTNKLSYKGVTKSKMISFSPGMSGIFDNLYHKGGLGFSNEKNMHYKTNDNYKIIGS